MRRSAIEAFVSVAVAPGTIRTGYTGTNLAPVGNRGRLLCIVLAASLVAAVSLPAAGADPGTVASVAKKKSGAKKKCKKRKSKGTAAKKGKCKKRKKKRQAGVSGLSIAPTYMDFPPLAIGQMSAPQALTVTNTGNRHSGSLSIALGGPNSSAFPIISDFCTRTQIGAGASCTINVSFAPPSTGSNSVTLSVIGDGGGTDVSLLRGTGTP